MGHNVFDTLLLLFFPKRCRGCKRMGTALCDYCIRRIPMAPELEDRHTFAVYDYGNTIVRWSVRDLKYHRKSESATALTMAAIPHISEFIGSEIYSMGTDELFLVPIPEYKSKLRGKGFNQSELIAAWIARALPGATVFPILEKIAPTIPQARLKRSARLKNVDGSMRAKEVLDSKNIYIIIDDVTTTGATFTEARRALRSGGARKILAVALAHGFLKK